MNRLQKKCLYAATGLHLLLLLILIVGPGFLSSNSKVNNDPVLEFVPSMLIDGHAMGGGNPAPRPPAPNPTPATPPQQEQRPTPPAQEPKREPAKEAVKEPVKEPIKETSKDQDALAVKPPTKKPQVNTTLVKRPPTKTKQPNPAKTDTDANAQARTQRQTAIKSALGNLRGGLSSSTTIDMGPVGPGGGGPSYANYAQEVRRVYTEAWVVPDDVTDDEASILVSVTIARDGSVISSRILDPSGSAKADRSIQNTLDRVSFVAPFPEGAKDSQRTFKINFSLKAKKLLG